MLHAQVVMVQLSTIAYHAILLNLDNLFIVRVNARINIYRWEIQYAPNVIMPAHHVLDYKITIALIAIY
jgi:hypothetical protein